MNSDAMVAILLTGVLIGLVLSVVLYNVFHHFKQIRNSNGMTLNSVKEKELCKQPHTWMKVHLMMGLGFNRDVNMCRVCGFIAGSKLMASQEMIDRLESLERKQKVEDELFKEFVTKEDSEVARWFEAEIKAGVDINKLMDLHNAGQSFMARFDAYVHEKSFTELTKKDM